MKVTSETLQSYFESVRVRVDDQLDRLLPGNSESPVSIHRAMRHSIFAGGKRLRPILCLESGRLFAGDESALLVLGCALEMIHTYSLIHDDLPALDDDELRRGQPTCHVLFGEATAILAGDALLTLAFEIMAGFEDVPSTVRIRVIQELAHSIGTRAGMVAGQVMDLEATAQDADAATLESMHAAKTGAFIRMAVRGGALYACAPEYDVERLTAYGEKIGLAFQIADDLLDVLGSSATLGKTAGKDGRQRKATYPALYGVEESQRIAARLVQEGCEALDPYGNRGSRLREIANFLISRNS